MKLECLKRINCLIRAEPRSGVLFALLAGRMERDRRKESQLSSFSSPSAFNPDTYFF